MRVVGYSCFEEYVKSFKLQGKILYAVDDLKNLRACKKGKLYFTADGLLHEYVQKLCTGTEICSTEGSCWIENDDSHGSDHRMESHTTEILNQNILFLQEKLDATNKFWNKFSALKDYISQQHTKSIIFVSTIYGL